MIMINFMTFLAIFSFQGQIPSDIDRAILNAYEANRLTLGRQGEISFERSQGIAKDEESAMKGEWTNRVTGKGLYVFRDKMIRYDMLYDAADIDSHSQKTDSRSITSTLNSFRLLSNGNVTLFDMKLGNIGANVHGTAQIHEGVDQAKKNISMPFDLGLYEEKEWRLGPLLTRSIRGDANTQIVERIFDENINGIKTCHIVFNFSSIKIHYWIDLATGALPIRYREIAQNGRITLAINWEDVRKIGPNTWFPYRETTFLSGRTARQTLITGANFGSSPNPALFQLEFPNPISIINESEKVRYAPQRVWNLSKLPNRNSPQAVHLNIVTSAQKSPPVPARSGNFTVLTIALGTVFLILGIGISLWRFRRAH